MLIIGFVIAIFFIVMICLIVRSYYKDIVELEERILQLEKRINECEKELKHKEVVYSGSFNGLITDKKTIKQLSKMFEKEGDETMACKKGKGGKRK